MNIVQVAQLTPDQFGDLIETRSYQGMKRALAEHVPSTPEGSSLPEYVTRKQAREFLNVSNTTLHEWGKDTEQRSAILIPFKINNHVRYKRADILAVLKESRRFRSDNRRK